MISINDRGELVFESALDSTQVKVINPEMMDKDIYKEIKDLVKDYDELKDTLDDKFAVTDDKQVICDKLMDVLICTDHWGDIGRLDYHSDTETVDITFRNGKRTVNVACYSSVAMIREIMNNIGI